jgi:hypothetical protein
VSDERAFRERVPEGLGGQLRLLAGGAPSEPAPDWELDERTRSIGKQGVAQAREILRRAHPPEGVLTGRRAS